MGYPPDPITVRGSGRTSGTETMIPHSRKIEVARSYVFNLEAKAMAYEALKADHMRLNSEAIDLAAHCLTLQRALQLVVESEQVTGQLQVVLDEILDGADSLLVKVWECACGHSKFDHDDLGCMYLGCRPICGVEALLT